MLRVALRAAVSALLAMGASQSLEAAPPPLSLYGELPAVEEMELSQSGKYIGVLTTINAERMLIVLDQDLKPVSKLNAGDIKVRSFRWVGDDALLVTTSRTESLPFGFVQNDLEFYSAMVFPVEHFQDYKIVFGYQADILPAIFGRYGVRKVDGEWHGYFGGIRLKPATGRVLAFDHGRPYLLDARLANGKAMTLDNPADEGKRKDWLLDDAGKVAATFSITESNGRWEIRNSGHKLVAEGVQPKGRAGLVALGRNGDTIIYFEENDDGDEQWFEVALAGGGTPQSVFDDVEVDNIYIDPLNGRTIGYRSQDDLVFFDPARQAVANKVKRAFKDSHVEMMDWTPDMSRLLVRTRGSGDSGTWYLVDVAQLRAEPIGYERPEIAPEKVGPVSLIEYKAADGLEMDGVLTLPPGREAKNLPVIMFPHGGPGSQDEVDFDWWAQAFASRGYAVFQPNFRGSTNRDKAFRRAGNGQWGRKMQTDISDGMAELVRRGIADPKRACIMGGSYGGYAALAGVTLQHGLYRCSVAVAGVSDLSLMYWTDYRESGGNKIRKRNVDEQLGPRSTFDEISPRKHAAEADAPILLIHGKDDTVVKFEQSAKMADALKDAGKPYEMIALEGEDHWLSRSETHKQMLEAAVAFVEKYNPAD